MDELQTFKNSLDSLRTKKATLQVKMEQAAATAAKIKARLQEAGYACLDDAIKDYNQRTAGLAEKQAKVEDLLKQIDAVEGKVPTREEVLQKLRGQASSKDAPAEPALNVAQIGEPPIQDQSAGEPQETSEGQSQGEEWSLPKFKL